jgi:hypothetical protein
VALELGQIEVRSAAFPDQPLRVVKQVEPEVEEAPGNGLPPHLQMLLVQMPAAGADYQRRHLGIELVLLSLGAREVQRPFDGVDQVDLALDEVRPGRGVGVLEVGSERRS